MNNKVVLAYSGGLDTTVILHWLTNQGYEVTALAIDLGQKFEDFELLKSKALMSGAKNFKSIDARVEFVSDYIMPCMMFNACYEGEYLLGTSMARPLIAKLQIELANEIGADNVSHGATGKGNDQARFEFTYLRFNPKIKIIAPWKLPQFYNKYPGRKELIAYSKEFNLPVKATLEQPWSSDENLMHISFEAGMLEDINLKPDPNMFELTTAPQNAPDETYSIEIEFEQAIPIKINGEQLSLLDLFYKLNEIASKLGIGRIDIVESRFIGMKSRGVYETPGGTVLWHAHRALESITLTRDVIDLKDSLMTRFASLVYNGFWFTPQMELLINMVKDSQKMVSGTVRLDLYKGNIITTGRSSKLSLYNEQLASMEKSDYEPQDALGFIKLNALPYMIDTLRNQKK